jgi:hypothetical protein
MIAALLLLLQLRLPLSQVLYSRHSRRHQEDSTNIPKFNADARLQEVPLPL